MGSKSTAFVNLVYSAAWVVCCYRYIFLTFAKFIHLDGGQLVHSSTIHEVERQNVVTELANVGKVAITSDGWTSLAQDH